MDRSKYHAPLAGATPLPSGSSAGGTSVDPSAAPAEEFVMRIVTLEHYMAPPLPGMDACWSELAGAAVHQVPVVRIYGSTPAGQKCLLHLHQAFPYFYVPYAPELPQDPAEAHWFLHRLALALETALNTASAFQQQHQQQQGLPGGPAYGVGQAGQQRGPPPLQQQPGHAGGGDGGGKQRVFGMTFVRGTPFYGYHAEECLWIKIMLYNPRDVGRAADLLRGGAVMGRAWQPHESHIPYLLQLKIDFNLAGMGWLRLRQARFRPPLPAAFTRQRRGWATRHLVVESEPGADSLLAPGGGSAGAAPAGTPSGSASQSMRLWTASSTPRSWVWGGGAGGGMRGRVPPRQSTCQLELDASVEHILNREQLVRLPLAAASPDVRMVESLAPMWAEEAMRCGGSGIPAPPPSPPRSPQPLSHAVAAVRQQLEEAVAGQQPAPLTLSPVELAPGQEQPTRQVPAGTPRGQPPPPAAHAAEALAGTPAGQVQFCSSMQSDLAVHGTPLLALMQAANQAALAPPGQQSGGLGQTVPAPTPISEQPGPRALESTAIHQGLALPLQAGTLATPATADTAPREQIPATPAFDLFAPPTQQRLQGWHAGAAPMLDEQLLMTQLTQQRQQAARWPPSRPRRQEGPEGEPDRAAPGWEEGQSPRPFELDADAWAYLQMRAEGTPADRGAGSSDEEEEALLAALAHQADAFGTPLSLEPSQQLPPSQPGGPPGLCGSQQPGSPSASQQEVALLRAQSAQLRALEAASRECEDILACSQLSGDGHGEEPGEEVDMAVQQEPQQAQRAQQRCDTAGRAATSAPEHGAQPPLPWHAPAGDIEDLAPPRLLRPREQGAPGQSAQQAQHDAAHDEHEEDAVFLQAMDDFERRDVQQQPHGRQAGPAPPPPQQQEPPAPSIPQTDGQCDLPCTSSSQEGLPSRPRKQRHLPQVDGSGDAIESDSGGEEASQHLPSQPLPSQQQHKEDQRQRRRAGVSSQSPMSQPSPRFAALSFDSRSPPEKQHQRLQGAPPAAQGPRQQQQRPARLQTRAASARQQSAMARPGSAGSLGSAAQRMAQYNVPGLRRKRSLQPPQQELAQPAVRHGEQAHQQVQTALLVQPLAPRGASEAEGSQPVALVQSGQVEAGGQSVRLQAVPTAAALPASEARPVADPEAPPEQAGLPLRRSKRQRQAACKAGPEESAPGRVRLRSASAEPQVRGTSVAAALPAEGIEAAPEEGTHPDGEAEQVFRAADSAGRMRQAYVARPRVREGSQAVAQVLAVLQPPSPVSSSSGGGGSSVATSDRSSGVSASPAASGSLCVHGTASPHMSREQVMQGSQNLGEVLSLLKPPSSGGTATATPSSPATSPCSGAAPAGSASRGSGSSSSPCKSPGSPAGLAAAGCPPPLSRQLPAAPSLLQNPALAAAAEAAAEEAEAAAAAALAAGQAIAAELPSAAAAPHPAAAAEEVVIPDSQPSPTPLKPARVLRQNSFPQEQQERGQQQAQAVEAEGIDTASPRPGAAEESAGGPGELQVVGSTLRGNTGQGQGQDGQTGGSPPPSAAQAAAQPPPGAASPLAGDSNDFAVELSGFTTPTGMQTAVLDGGAGRQAPESTAASGQQKEEQTSLPPTQQAHHPDTLPAPPLPPTQQALQPSEQVALQQHLQQVQERAQPLAGSADADAAHPGGLAGSEALQSDDEPLEQERQPLEPAAAEQAHERPPSPRTATESLVGVAAGEAAAEEAAAEEAAVEEAAADRGALKDLAVDRPVIEEAATADTAMEEAAASGAAGDEAEENEGEDGQPDWQEGGWWEGWQECRDASQVPALFDDGWGGGWRDDEFLHLTYPSPEGSPGLPQQQGSGGRQPPSQPEQRGSPEGGTKEGGPPTVWRFARPPPSEADLAASGWELGVPPVVATQAHYGCPGDAPARPTVFAGREHRVPTAAVAELPPFASSCAPHALHQLWQEREQLRPFGLAPPLAPLQRRQLLAFVPAKPPPSREDTDSWLAARRRRRRGKGRPFRGGGMDYAMNPNTGQLIPIGPQPQRPSSAGSAGAGGGTPSALLGDAELLGTPQLSGLSSQGGSGSFGGSPSTPAGPTQTPDGALAAAAAAGHGGTDSGGSEDERGEAGEDGGSGGAVRGAAASPADDEGEVQPSSPKYDERTFFFSNPFPTLQLTQQRPTLATQRQRQRQRRQQAAAATAGSGGVAADAEHTPARQGVRPFELPPLTAGGAVHSAAQPRPSSRLRESDGGGAGPETAQVLGGSQPMDSSQGSPASAPQQHQQLRARPGAAPGSTLLKTVLKSALKSAAGSRLGASGHEEALQLQHSQGSDGSGSGAKRVSFAASPTGDGSQDGAQAGRPSLSATPPPAAQQHSTPAEARSVGAAAAAAAAVAPTLAPSGNVPTDATLATERTQRKRQGFISQITPPSPGLGGGSAAAATPLSQAGFKMRRCVSGKGQQLTLLSLELHADSRGSLLPDPRHDAVRAVVLAVADDDEEVPDAKYTTRVLLFDGSLAPGQAEQQAGPAAAPGVPQQAPQAPHQPSATDVRAGLPHRIPHSATGLPAGAAATAAAPGAAARPGVAHTPGMCPAAASPVGASGLPEGMPEPEIAAAPPAASTSEEAMLAPAGSQGSLDPATGHPILPSLRLTQRVAPGLRNPAAANALGDVQVDLYASEAALLGALGAAVAAADPDIVLGYEVQRASLGYAAERAAELGLPSLLRALSRLPRTQGAKEDVGGGGAENPADEYAWQTASGLHCSGRIVLNVWRLMRTELKLTSYSFESCVAAVLQLRVPHVPQQQLHAWFAGGAGGGRWRCLEYWVRRARLNLALLDQLDLVGRTGEMARTFGIDFFSVLSRGSQYRVESMMARLARTQNYLLLHPGREQVARQPAMEALPLVMEPVSRLYTDPVVVLDFQSLYPSMIIAYNLCFSTCLGRPRHAAAGGAGPPGAVTGALPRLGCAEFGLPAGTLAGQLAPGRLVVTPNGVAFAPKDARPGVLPRLLQEILNTRIMVKGAMKRAPKSAKVLLRCLNARQFGLKLIANVTYGYTAAGFSGRMPMAELADAIVQSGRETLESAIRMVNGHPDWRAQVVYGDTDSMFVLLPGRSREEAFRIGAEIASAVTAANPPPVVLKMEKVYSSCVLLSKKRYVGFSYEAPSQATPIFDAKGIETVRRDTCPAVAKMMEAVLRLLFTTKDLSQVKAYCERQFNKILSGRVSIADFVFAKEVRLGTYSNKAAHIPPAALVATRAMSADPRAEPRFGERVPYVVVHGEPGARLFDMVVPPRALVESRGELRLHALYYITRQIIPALDRVLSLVGADIKAWFAEMPRQSRMLPQKRPLSSLPLLAATNAAAARAAGAGPRGLGGKAATIDRYYLSRHCAVCDELTHATKPLCERCTTQPQLAAGVLAARWGRLERQYAQLVRLCAHCGGGGGLAAAEGGIVCDSLDCGVYFERRKLAAELAAVEALAAAGLRQLDEAAEAELRSG